MKWIIPLGFLLTAIGIGGILWLYAPVVYYQARYALRQGWFYLVREKPNYPDWQATGDYMIYVPKIEAKAPVIAQVNAGDQKEYLKALKRGVAEAAGLSVPGRRGTTYLFAHSTDNPLNFSRYNAVFYLLDKLVAEDRIEIYYRGNYYHYAMEKKEVLEASDLRYFVPQFQEERLILQTCWPPGTTQKRLVVVAKRT